jgi:hypothetical protein
VQQLAEAVQEVTGHNMQLAYVDAGHTGEQAAKDGQTQGIRLMVVKLPGTK